MTSGRLVLALAALAGAPQAVAQGRPTGARLRDRIEVLQLVLDPEGRLRGWRTSRGRASTHELDPEVMETAPQRLIRLLRGEALPDPSQHAVRLAPHSPHDRSQLLRSLAQAETRVRISAEAGLLAVTRPGFAGPQAPPRGLRESGWSDDGRRWTEPAGLRGSDAWRAFSVVEVTPTAGPRRQTLGEWHERAVEVLVRVAEQAKQTDPGFVPPPELSPGGEDAALKLVALAPPPPGPLRQRLNAALARLLERKLPNAWPTPADVRGALLRNEGDWGQGDPTARVTLPGLREGDRSMLWRAVLAESKDPAALALARERQAASGQRRGVSAPTVGLVLAFFFVFGPLLLAPLITPALVRPGNLRTHRLAHIRRTTALGLGLLAIDLGPGGLDLLPDSLGYLLIGWQATLLRRVWLGERRVLSRAGVALALAGCGLALGTRLVPFPPWAGRLAGLLLTLYAGLFVAPALSRCLTAQGRLDRANLARLGGWLALALWTVGLLLGERLAESAARAQADGLPAAWGWALWLGPTGASLIPAVALAVAAWAIDGDELSAEEARRAAEEQPLRPVRPAPGS